MISPNDRDDTCIIQYQSSSDIGRVYRYVLYAFDYLTFRLNGRNDTKPIADVTSRRLSKENSLQTQRSHIGNDTCVRQRQNFGNTTFVCIMLVGAPGTTPLGLASFRGITIH